MYLGFKQFLERNCKFYWGNVPPVGSITMYLGSTAPAGWLLCDGKVLPSDVKYDALNTVLSSAYGDVGGRSKVPDLRGRMAVGLDNMGGNSANRVVSSSADNIEGGRVCMMNKRIRKIAILVASAFALGQADVARAADANPPERMTYQGYLVDVNGDADAVGSGWVTEKL
jgi:microcystin-dependent protein